MSRESVGAVLRHEAVITAWPGLGGWGWRGGPCVRAGRALPAEWRGWGLVAWLCCRPRLPRGIEAVSAAFQQGPGAGISSALPPSRSPHLLVVCDVVPAAPRWVVTLPSPLYPPPPPPPCWWRQHVPQARLCCCGRHPAFRPPSVPGTQATGGESWPDTFMGAR